MRISLNRLSPLVFSDHLERYDIFLGAVGYEGRAKFVYQEALARNVKIDCAIGFEFTKNRVLKFEENRKFFRENGAILVNQDAILECLRERFISTDEFRILVDISSMTRAMIARIVSEINDWVSLSDRKAIVDFCYSLGEFCPPPANFGPIRAHGPVIPEFGGMQFEAGAETALLMGLGYEPDIALGVYEAMEPDRLAVFVPSGRDSKFDSSVADANKGLLDGLDRDQVFHYSLVSPVNTFNLLVGVCNGSAVGSRFVFVPFGPKIFALICMLVSCANQNRISVWRISPVDIEQPASVEPLGEIVCFRTYWGGVNDVNAVRP